MGPTRQFSVQVEVLLRAGIADPQGATIERALPALGFDGVTAVRAGKSFRFDLAADDEADALAQATVVADRLLANPVIEESAGDCPAGRCAGLMAPRIGVVLFPGTNCEHDVVQAVERLGGTAELVWHGATSTSGYDAVSCRAASPTATTCGPAPSPGSRRSWRRWPSYAADGGPVVGICNGFQVLTEAGLLPGALQKNRGLRFLCTTTTVRVDATTRP